MGLGRISQRAYLPVLANLDTADLAVLMSRRPQVVEHFQSRYHVPAGVTDLSDLIHQGLQAAVVLNSITNPF